MMSKLSLCKPNNIEDMSNNNNHIYNNKKSSLYWKNMIRRKNLTISSNLVRTINSESLVFFVIIIFSLQLTRIHGDSVLPSSSRSTILLTTTTSSQQQQQQQKNTLLTDEIDHESLNDSENSNRPHVRKKRLIWITDDGRLALPPGTSLTITPTLALPLVRHPPEGFFSNVSISFPLTIDFDKLGLTDNQNPLGDFPPLFARSFGHAAGEMLGNYVARYLHYKRKRDLNDQTSMPTMIQRDSVKKPPIETIELPQLPDRFKHIFHGGERVMLYIVVEDFLSTFGMDGKACLLRTICEIHSQNLDHFGIFGEMAKLFLTVTKSPFADLVPEYVQAQEIGEGRKGPGECFPYYKDCPKSLFKAIQNNKYSKHQNHEYHEEKVEEIDTLNPFLDSDPSKNEIPNRHESLLQHTLSM